MFDESLLEFEESLSSIGSSHELLRNNTDLKVDLNRFCSSSLGHKGFSEQELFSFFTNYDYESDDVTVCYSCGNLVGSSSKDCCRAYVADQKLGLRSLFEKSYWTSFFENPYKTILALPNYTKMCFLQCGMPVQLRSIVWQRLILISQTNQTEIPEVSLMLFKNFQHSYNKSISNQINKDLSRTFPSVAFFQREDTIQGLLTILNVYANYDLDLGYCQGLLFLVGTLYHLFRQQEFTFHALCKIMECEPELRGIFVPLTMSSILNKWNDEFSSIFSRIDPELAQHLASFCDCKVFLYQWWLSFLLIHSPGMGINQRIVDLCLLEGWKVGIFKISMGLLVCNKPILMSFGEGDEEVVYQHLLNESKWGNIVNSLTSFFADHMSSWDASLFTFKKAAPAKTHKRTATATVIDAFKNFTVSGPGSAVSGLVSSGSSGSGFSEPRSTGSVSSASSTFSTGSSRIVDTRVNRSSLTVSTSSRTDLDSVYSDVHSTCSSETHRSLVDLLKVPGRKTCEDTASIASRNEMDILVLENQVLKFLLKKACSQLSDPQLKNEILQAVDLDTI